MKHLLEFAADLTNHDPMIASAIEAALRSPPMTNEEVGFYGAAKNPPEMNCFLYLVTSLGNAGYTFSAEDKYTNDGPFGIAFDSNTNTLLGVSNTELTVVNVTTGERRGLV